MIRVPTRDSLIFLAMHGNDLKKYLRLRMYTTTPVLLLENLLHG